MISLVGPRSISDGESVKESQVDISPILDVVFIMLIFFFITASFVKESGVALNLPSTGALTTPTAALIVVEISSINIIRIQLLEVSTSAVESTISRLRVEHPEASVVVRLHPDAKTDATVDGIRAANVEFPYISLLKG